jgi:hypothetical protein
VSGFPPGESPWADPNTPTEPGQPYSGPPSTPPHAPYGYPGYGPAQPGYGYPPGQPYYGYPPGQPYGYGSPYGYPAAPYGAPGAWWPVPAPPPRRPGQVITSAVLAFVQAGLVVFASLYVWLFASLLDLAAQSPGFPGAADGIGAEGTVLAIVQFVSAAFLIAAGIRALSRRTRGAWVLLLVALGVQVVLAVYWGFRLSDFFGSMPGPDPSGVVVGLSLLFAAAPVVGIGLVAAGAGRRWFEPDAAPSGGAPPGPPAGMP